MRKRPTCFVVMPYGKRPVESVEIDFDIKDVKILSYELKRSSLDKAIDNLREQIERVGNAVNPDSPAFLYLEGLRVMTGSPRAYARDDRTYEILDDAER